MESFEQLNLSKPLLMALEEHGYERPTPIQAQSFSVICSGKNVVGIAQTGTGKTLAYVLPCLQMLPFADQINPRILVLVPTRELVLQVVEVFERFTELQNRRVIGVYGGTNINTQKHTVLHGTDVIVGTPGRLYDLVLSGALSLKSVKRLIIDEVDVMLDLGFRFQLTNIFELLPQRRQNIMFSATMTEEIDNLIDVVFISPVKLSIAVSGTPLDNIRQSSYAVHNFHTKMNLLSHILSDKDEFQKVLVFAASKKDADRIFDNFNEAFGDEMAVIHSNKSQNYRIRSVRQFDAGVCRILIATDVIARGLDLHKISHVINMNPPLYPENYMHRIGRTGRAEVEGQSILFFTENEIPQKEAIEYLMAYEIARNKFPDEVVISHQLTPEERQGTGRSKHHNRNTKERTGPSGFHEKIAKNKKVNLGGKYKREIGKKYKKSKTRGDKIANRRKKK